MQKRQDVAIKNIENQMGQLAKMLTERQPGTWPSNTEVNPKEKVNAITTRSGVELPEIHVKRSGVDKETASSKERATTSEKAVEKEKEDSLPEYIPPPAYVPPILFPQRLQKHKLDKQFEKFLEVFKKLQINIPFADALAQMPSYAKFMQLGLREANPTTISLQLVDRSVKCPRGVVEDILVKVDKFIFPANFIILDMGEDRDVPLILGRSFLATGRVLIDVQKGQLVLRLNEEQVTFNVFKAIQYSSSSDSCFQIDIIDHEAANTFTIENPSNR
ncbi:Uncharacterized protein Adt_27301 [Abeliophyllum distichum]|uniref:Aspartic peptidase DDI1-type domain-containing protein n=1 Tax=Abeliophyllum distichum TaxID=126358 RepID=A0ABD1RTC8_9LAMI